MLWKAPNHRKIRMLAAAAIVLAAFAVLLWHTILAYEAPDPVVENSEVQALPTSAARVAEPIGVPVRIKIPSIAVDASIEKVALTPEGSMDVPKDPLDTAWYELGPRPGQPGSAAIAGHVDWLQGATGVFADLYKVKPGDTIAVQDEVGEVISFVVREIRKYDAAAVAMDVFSSNDGKAHLNLITCDGVWNKLAKQYSERLVVFADREVE